MALGFSFSASLKPRTRSTLVSDPLTPSMMTMLPLPPMRLEQVARGLEPEAVIVGADEGDEFAAGGAVGDVDDRNLGGVDLLDARHHRLVVDRNEDDRARLLHDDILDLAELLGDAVRLGRHVLHDVFAFSDFAHVVGADPHRLEIRVGLVLGEDGDGLAVGSRRRCEHAAISERQRARASSVFHVVSFPLLLVIFRDLIARGGGSSCRSRPRGARSCR